MKITKHVDDAAYLLAHPGLIKWVRHGLQIQPNKAYRAPWIRDLDIGTVLDVGANVGQAAINFCTAFPSARVHSFEPIPDCFATLRSLTTSFANLRVHNYALGNTAGEIDFHLNEYSPSSSILQLSDEHLRSFPHATEAARITVPIRRLDDVATDLDISGNLLVKLDVQGYEGEVLAGGMDVVRGATMVVAETSIESLYDGDSSFAQIYRLLTEAGFAYHGSLEQLLDPSSGRVLQQDAVFLRAATGGTR